MAKKIIVEFEVDQSLEYEDLCNVLHDAIRKARFEVDEKLGRIGTGKPSSLGLTTIRFNGFDGVNRVWHNGSFRMHNSHRRN